MTIMIWSSHVGRGQKASEKSFLGGTPPSGSSLKLIRLVHYFKNEKSCLFKTQSLHIVGVPQFGLPLRTNFHLN